MTTMSDKVPPTESATLLATGKTHVATRSASRDSAITWKDAVKQITASCIAHSLVIQAGINMSFSAVLLPQLADETSSDMRVDTSVGSWIASVVTLSVPVASVLIGPLMDRYGRKNLCISTTLPFMISWLVTAYAKSVWHIYVARIIAGFTAGLTTVALVYVSEITHPNFRPMLLSLNSVFVSLGILLTCSMGLLVPWRILAVVNCGIVALSFVALFFVPESPYWLVAFKGDEQKAVKSLKWLYGEGQLHQQQYQQLRSSTTTNPTQPNTGATSWDAYKQPTVYKPLTILLLIFAFQQLSGAYAIIFYAVDLFRKLGADVEKAVDERVSLALLGAIRFAIALLSAITSKYLGRRRLLATSGVGMGLCSLAACLYLSASTSQGNDVPLVVCVLGYVCCSSFGYLVIPWTLIGELFPVKVRGTLGGVTVAVAYVLMFGVVKGFPYALERVALGSLFLAMTVVNFLGVGFVYWFLPETLGKSFAEIEECFRR